MKKIAVLVSGGGTNLQALIDGKPAEEAAQELIKPHRNVARLQQDFIRAWKSKKVKVSFPKK